jgi:hypothetical protein
MNFLTVEIFHTQHPELMKREHKHAVRHGMYAGAQLWAERLLMEHFLPGARSEFGYAERTVKYKRRKIRLAAIGAVEDGGRQDLVATGNTRRAARRSRYMVKATDKVATVSVVVPSYIQRRPNRNARQALALEILVLSERHTRLVTNETDRGFNRKLQSIRAERRTVIRK